MTVCIAAIAQYGQFPVVVTAGDRKVSALSSNIAYERPQPKGFALSKSVICLTSGDTPAQSAVCLATVRALQGQSTVSVENAVEAYVNELALFKRKQVDREELARFGFSWESFVDRHRDMSDEFISRIFDAVNSVDPPVIETIITGVDSQGAHIYVVYGTGYVTCNTELGFATIGSGGRHAGHQFMLANYANWWPLDQSMLLTYVAKKRAEVDPGVGKDTDVFAVLSAYREDSIVRIRQDIVEAINQSYLEMIDKEHTAFEHAKTAVGEAIAEIVTQTEAEATPPADPTPKRKRTKKDR